jgi:hypothetical protein
MKSWTLTLSGSPAGRHFLPAVFVVADEQLLFRVDGNHRIAGEARLVAKQRLIGAFIGALVAAVFLLGVANVRVLEAVIIPLLSFRGVVPDGQLRESSAPQ